MHRATIRIVNKNISKFEVRSGVAEDSSLLGCDAVWLVWYFPALERTVEPLLSGPSSPNRTTQCYVPENVNAGITQLPIKLHIQATTCLLVLHFLASWPQIHEHRLCVFQKCFSFKPFDIAASSLSHNRTKSLGIFHDKARN